MQVICIIKIFSSEIVAGAENVGVYDSLDSDVIQSYMEYSLASLIYYTLKEGATSEQSSRMSAMDNSSKNAGMENSRLFVQIFFHPSLKYHWYDI